MWLLVCLLLLPVTGNPLPAVEGETLTGRKTLLPDALRGQVSVVVWSFTRDAGGQVEKWMAPLVREQINVYSAAVIEAAPRLIRPMIRSAIRRASAKSLHGRSMCITRGERALREALEVRNDKLPIVTVLDSEGRILWRHAGPYTEAAARELMRQLHEAR
ncbi:MAG: hypothetical protein ACUVS7_15495 [Bryobacteraceae bacterium]